MADYPVRILWDTDAWFRFTRGTGEIRAWSNAGGLPSNGAESNANGLLLATRAAFKGKRPADLLASPRLGDWLGWDVGGSAVPLVNTVPDPSTGGRLPPSQDWYTVRVSLPEAQKVDCLYIVGIENADMTIYHSTSGSDTAWTELTNIDSYNDLELRQSKHWTGQLAQKFITFTEVNRRYWRFDFEAVSGLPFFGLISTIMGGLHYEVESNLSPRFSIAYRSPGASSGGLWHSEFRDDPCFRSAPFAFAYAPYNDLQAIQQMVWERTNGDPVAIQYSPGEHPDLHSVYGVIADNSRYDPVLSDDQNNIQFRVNELAPARDKGYLT